MESFTTNQSALCNQGQAFICLHCFHRVTFTKKTFRWLCSKNYTENSVHGTTLRNQRK